MVMDDKGKTAMWKIAEYENEPLYSHVVEIAKTGRARCRKCVTLNKTDNAIILVAHLKLRHPRLVERVTIPTAPSPALPPISNAGTDMFVARSVPV